MNYEVNCHYCKRYLLTAMSTTIIEQLVCSNTKCKARLNIKIVSQDSTTEQLNYKFSQPETPPKTA